MFIKILISPYNLLPIIYFSNSQYLSSQQSIWNKQSPQMFPKIFRHTYFLYIIIIINKEKTQKDSIQMSAFTQQTSQYVQQIKAGANSILVAIRVRPLSQKQKKISSFETIKVLQGKLLSLNQPDIGSPVDILRKNRNKQIQYAFDYVFDKNITTKSIYEQTVSILLDGLLQGYNASVLAYGATSCGKTYTMIGQNQHIPGLMAMTVLQLLNYSNSHKKQKYKDIKLKASYIEIYNQNIKDLLISQDRNLQIRQDPKQGITIAGITQVLIDSIGQLKTVLKVGNHNRTIQSTGCNQVSSRSHSIFTISIQIKNNVQSTINQIIISKLYLIDLAGSQRAANTANTNKGQRMIQGAKINQSLLVLGNCIQALSDGNQKGLKNIFVPYRGSKLTRLLKDSLGGNCRTVMIAHVSPVVNLFQETYNTLVYAHRAKNIKNNPIRNTLIAQTHLNNYVNIINNLKRQNQQLKNHIKQKQINTLQRQRSMGYGNVYKNSGTTLPMLNINNSQYNEEINKYQNMIAKHFIQEDQIICKISELELKIEKIAFQIYQQELIGNDEKIIKNKSNQAAELSKQKMKLEKRLEEKTELRSKLIKQFSKNDTLGSVGQLQLNNSLKEKKVQLAFKSLKFKQDILKQQKKQMNKLIKFMKNSMKNREDIIEKQKLLIKKNNIISRITYSQLNFDQQQQSKSIKSQRNSHDKLNKNKGSRSAKKLYFGNSQTKRNVLADKSKNQSLEIQIENQESRPRLKKNSSFKKKQAQNKRKIDKISQDFQLDEVSNVNLDYSKKLNRQPKDEESPRNKNNMVPSKKIGLFSPKNSKSIQKSRSLKTKAQFDFIYMAH